MIPKGNFPSQAMKSREVLHLPDWTVLDLPPFEQAIHEQVGIMSSLYLPFLRGKECLGLLCFIRQEKRPFSKEEIDIAQSFCDQAVIAIENVRLFQEGAGRPRRCRNRQRSQEFVSGNHEP